MNRNDDNITAWQYVGKATFKAFELIFWLYSFASSYLMLSLIFPIEYALISLVVAEGGFWGWRGAFVQKNHPTKNALFLFGMVVSMVCSLGLTMAYTGLMMTGQLNSINISQVAGWLTWVVVGVSGLHMGLLSALTIIDHIGNIIPVAGQISRPAEMPKVVQGDTLRDLPAVPRQSANGYGGVKFAADMVALDENDVPYPNQSRR